MPKILQLLILLSTLLAGCRETPGPDSVPSSVKAPREFQGCYVDADCILVDNSCDQCCQREAVNRKDSLSFERYRARECDGYSGGVCDCCFTVAHAECKAGRCIQVVDSHECGGP